MSDINMAPEQIGLAPAGWRRSRKIAVFLALLVATSSSVRGGETPPEPLEDFDEFVTAAMKEWNVPGAAIAIVHSNHVVIAKGYGFRDVERKLPVTSNTLFAIGSTTKAFTTFLMGTLVDEGKLAWDKPVREFLPEFRLSDPRTTELITPRDLVTHRSGLPRHDLVWYNNTTSTREEVVQRLAHLEATETLRAKFQYNNLMYLAAGHLVEHVTGKSWEANVRERILRPLNMTNSNFSVRESTNTADFALPYEEKEERVRDIAFRNIDLVGPAGSINSSVAEMSRWLLVNLNKGKFGKQQLIQPSTLADIHSPQMPMGVSPERPEISQPVYTLGWAIQSYRGHRRLSHGGGIDGFITHVTVLPDDQLGVVVFANLNKTSLPGVLANHTLDRALNLKAIDWKAEALTRRKKSKESDREAKTTKQSARKTGTKPSHQREDYVGTYEHPGYGELAVNLRSNEFVAVINAMSIPLEHWHYDVFNAVENGADEIVANKKFNFATDENGNISSVALRFDGAAKEILFTKKVDPRLSDTNYIARFVGEYDLSGYSMNVSLSGDNLRLDIPGERQYQLVPNLDGGFTLKEQSQFSLKFAADEQDKTTAALLHRPEGVVTAKRKN
jgi:CubicO group peptidase (beta-lactamase class C family)